MRRRFARIPAHTLLFPAAALWAIAMVTAKAGAAAGWWQPPGHWPATWHGHELIFGFALAVVGGYLVTRPGLPGVLAVLAAWAAGRATLLAPGLSPALAAAGALAYPLALFIAAGLPLARAAKKPRNRVFAPLLGALVAAEGLYQLGAAGLVAGATGAGLLLAADLLLLLLFVMGGRFLASVTSGLHQARGRWLVRLSQPRLERAGVLLLAAMAVLDPLAALAPLPAALPGGAGLAAAVVLALRLAGWQGWRLLDDTGAAALQAGYLWLGLGLGLKGVLQLAGGGDLVAGLHLALIGGLGTLTLTVMTRVVRSRRRLAPPLPAIGAVAAGLVGVAAAARLAAWADPQRVAWLVLAAAAWGLGWLLVLGLLGQHRDRD